MTKTLEKQEIPSFHLILAAGGSSTRFGGETPKQFLRIAGKTVLEHALDKFLKFTELKSVVIVIPDEFKSHLSDYITNNPKVIICESGKSRKNSIFNGLNSFLKLNSNDIILVHDAARPLVSHDDIQNILAEMVKSESATLAAPVKDTLLKNEETIDREDMWAIQTPQAFTFEAIKTAHDNFKDDDNFTDDAGMVRANGEKVNIVPSTSPNIKITTPSDFDMVKAMIEQNSETRATSGFDVHAFENEKTDRPLKLGGIIVEHDFALTGHSDADVVLHAVTDAILGGINKGDIGTHFPPSDPQWKDKDSSFFLKHAYNMLLSKGGDIRFIDITIMAEVPKMGPYREKMQNRIAEILNIAADRISIKATTTEKLGFVGRQEGIACQALATMTLPPKDAK
ncbi:MAG: bifunctional 2-C-methyl-D-erythritol 4-phosphate cytidylyltransferase/2-C-methyl-D-erythritol 2,4-cyclodiphosphate synthase [Pseudomonadota bacterium]